MNTNHHIADQADLEQLIERYFDGNTSLQEEQVLKEILADCPWSSETIDEARFTMGYFVAHKQQGNNNAVKSNNRFRYGAIAASVAVLLTIGVSMGWHSYLTEDVCIAYVNGQAINDKDEVMMLMQNDLNEIGNATQSLEEQLSSLGDAIEIDI